MASWFKSQGFIIHSGPQISCQWVVLLLKRWHDSWEVSAVEIWLLHSQFILYVFNMPLWVVKSKGFKSLLSCYLTQKCSVDPFRDSVFGQGTVLWSSACYILFFVYFLHEVVTWDTYNLCKACTVYTLYMLAIGYKTKTVVKISAIQSLQNICVNENICLLSLWFMYKFNLCQFFCLFCIFNI